MSDSRRPPSPPVSAPPHAGAAIRPRAGVLDRRHAIRGGLWMLLAAACFTGMNALAKYLGASLPTSTIVFFRMAIGLAVILPVALATSGGSILQSAVPGRQAVRSLLGVASLACVVYAVHALDFATATALAFTTPLWIVVLSFFFLGERPSGRALVAAAVGFAGILVIARPGVSYDPAVMVALAGALFGAAALTMMRSISFHDRSLTMLIWFSALGAIYSAGPAALFWSPPDALEFALLCATGVFGAAGLFCAAQAYSAADAAVVAPVDFVRLPFATMVGVLIFSEVPDAFTLVGSLMILGALTLTMTNRQESRG